MAKSTASLGFAVVELDVNLSFELVNILIKEMLLNSTFQTPFHAFSEEEWKTKLSHEAEWSRSHSPFKPERFGLVKPWFYSGIPHRALK